MENVYLKEYEAAGTSHNRGMGFGSDWELRERLVKLYAWAIPNDEALDLIGNYGPIIEIGAGTGYWAALLQSRGVDVKAYDLKPPEGEDPNPYKHSVGYTNIHEGDSSELSGFVSPRRTLFLCWPPYASPMAYDCLKAYRGSTVIYIGEGDGGCTGDDAFHELLSSEWEEIEYCEIPQFTGLHDALSVYRRKN